MEITFFTSRYAAPMSRATTDTSPMVPGIFPTNMAATSTVPPFFKAERGVAPDTPSSLKADIWLAKEIRRKHLAARAGFIKFCPKPP